MTFRRISIFVALVALACYAISLRATFVYDDRGVIEFDSRIGHFDQWHRYFTETYNNGIDNLYRPLTSFSFALQYAIHGDNPLPFHIVNWLLHALVSVQVARLAWTWFETNPRRDRIALIAGLLFALHPVHVEAVVGIVGRAELLCAVFFLGALQLISRPLTRARAIMAIVCLLGAVGSKEQGIVLIPIALIVRCLRQQKSPGETERNRAKITFSVASILLALYVIWRENLIGLKFFWEKIFLDNRIQPLATLDDLAPRLLASLPIVGRALAQLFFPLNLTIDYAGYITAQPEFNSIWPWLGILAIALWLALFTRSFWRNDRVMMVCLLAFVITYGLVSNIVMIIGTAFGERLLYLPSVFLVLIVSSWLARWPRPMVMAVTITICLAFSVRTIAYASLWSDRQVLYGSLMEQWPANPRLHMLYGSEVFDRGQKVRGIESSMYAVKLDPTYDRALRQAAQLYVLVDELDQAESMLDRLDQVRPGMSRGIRAQIDRRRLSFPKTNPATRPLDKKSTGK